METKVLFKGFQYRSSQDKVNKNSLYQDEVGGGCLQQDRWILWSSVCVCVFMCVGGCPFIYFSGGENSLAQLIFRLTLAYGETAGGGESGSGECILKIENRVNGNAWKYERIWEEVFFKNKNYKWLWKSHVRVEDKATTYLKDHRICEAGGNKVRSI